MIAYIFPHDEGTHIHSCIIEENDYKPEWGQSSLIRCRCHADTWTTVARGETYTCKISKTQVTVT